MVMRQLFKRKFVTVLQIGLAISTLGCAAGGDDMSTGEPAGTAGNPDQSTQPVDHSELTTSGTWVVSPDEFCADFFPFPPHNGVCTSTFPSPQCAPTVVAGQACSPVGDQCFKTLSSRKFRIFDCV